MSKKLENSAENQSLPPTLEIPHDLGEPVLSAAEDQQPIPENPMGPTQWTPEVVKMLVSGLWTMLVAWRGPHWALTPEETDPLWDPTAITLNNTPGLRNLAPEHMAIAITIAGWGTIAGKRAAWDRQIRQPQQKQTLRRTEERQTPEATGSPYGPNRTEG